MSTVANGIKSNCLGVTNDKMADLVVRTISCSNNDLADFLRKSINFLIKRHNYCTTQLDFINVQLELIINAQLFVANLVSYSDSRSVSKSLTRNKATTDAESKSQQTAQSRSCLFSDSSSFSQFTRTSVDRSRSQADTRANASGASDSSAYDRSVATASGFSAVWDTSRSTSMGEGFGEHDETSQSAGKSYQRTHPDYVDYHGVDPGQISNTALIDIASLVINNLIAAISSIDITFIPEFSISVPGANQFLTDLANAIGDPVGDDYNVPQIELPTVLLNGCCCKDSIDAWGDCTIFGQPDECHYDNYPIKPSYGRSYNASYNFSLSATLLGFGFTVNQSWTFGGSFQQSEVHTQSCSRSISNSMTANDYEQIDWARSKGVSEAHDESQNTSDIHSVSDSQRTSHSRTDAGSAATGDSYATSETGADRAAHSEGRGSGQGSSWSKSRTRSNSLSQSDSKSDSIAENLSDISRALGEMFDLLSDEKSKLKRLLNGKQGVAIGRIESCNQQYAIPPDPVQNATIRSLTAIWHRNQCDDPIYN